MYSIDMSEFRGRFCLDDPQSYVPWDIVLLIGENETEKLKAFGSLSILSQMPLITKSS